MADLAVKIDTVAEPVEHNNVISFNLIRNIAEQDAAKPKPTKANNRVVGESTEVYPFSTVDEIEAMVNVFDKHIENAENNDQYRIALRNKMLFIIGINIGIRASDLRTLKYSFFFNEDGSRKDFYKIQPKKTRKQKKFVTLYFNDAVWSMLDMYLSKFPYKSLNDYLFFSRVGDEPIEVNTLRRVVKSTAKEAGIAHNVGSHSLRKTFGYWVWHNAKDKEKMLVILSQIYNHSDVSTTRKYIGLTNDEMEDTFNSLNLGLDLI